MRSRSVRGSVWYSAKGAWSRPGSIPGRPLMDKADAVRQELEERATRREGAKHELQDTTAHLAAFIREIQQSKAITMSEAAKIVGVSRVQLYNMLKG